MGVNKPWSVGVSKFFGIQELKLKIKILQFEYQEMTLQTK